ncbi:hypothetical protein GVN21_12485 [Caulobacter sp. SLTY]|uniref:hypothetical protein n=1 Tax=Caulobacter sp. SLTY TaxID=2683262 RepID=UPI001411B314|nr:hypothetical protein [Caulobacter sp. SLTY]NBB16176.1 hypothetical protein [Caulobacter sp. SLTY]
MRVILAVVLAFLPAAQTPVLARASEAVGSDCVFMPESDLTGFNEGPEVMAQAEREGLARARRLGVGLKPPRGYTAGRVLVSGTRYVKGGPDIFVALRAPDGGWFIRARMQALDLRRGRPLSASEARKLETALADRCLAEEPTRAPRTRPSRNPGELIVCADGQDSFIEVDIQGGLRRKFFHECTPSGAATRLKEALTTIAVGVRP